MNSSGAKTRIHCGALRGPFGFAQGQAAGAPLFHVTAGVREEHRSHVKQAQARQAVFFQKALVDILFLQLLDLCCGHFAPVGG